jgi:hypothetical protein
MLKPTQKIIEGKVAKVLNNRELVINRGSQHGVRVGDKFKVGEKVEQILDPDTGKILGSLSQEKVRVKIVNVQPAFSIGQTYETYQEYEPTSPARVFSPRIITKVKTIRSSETGDSSAVVVYIGDNVTQLGEDEGKSFILAPA